MRSFTGRFYYNDPYELYRQLASASQVSTSNTSKPTPKFNVGDRVTVRTGKTVYAVKSVSVEYSHYSSSYDVRYRLVSAQNREVTEDEDDLKAYADVPPIEAKPKVVVNFDTVIIADEKRQQILEALEQINQTELIFTKWGFGETIEKGKGVSLLFWGPPGTGKTLMAQAIANKLGKKLKVIASADVESSAPGQAERNIRQHFKEAKEKNDTVLLFDECDSLLYSREGVGAILGAQINELLSQLERYDGVTIFTTNRLGTLDEAVNRRLALKLEFDMPTLEQRAEIWQRMFPKACPLDKDIDWMRLAIVEVTGGYIKNAVLRAARMAAAEKVPDSKKKISMAHLIQAIKLEAESMVRFEEVREAHVAPQGHLGLRRGYGGLTKEAA